MYATNPRKIKPFDAKKKVDNESIET